MGLTPRRLLAGIAGVSLAAVALALLTQHVFEMQPCPWCVLQRLIFVLIALLALMGLVWRTVTGRRVAGILLLVLCGAGVAAALWQHFVAAASNSCNLTLADRIVSATGLPTLLPEVFEARASCADAAVALFGVPYEFWSLGLFVAIAIASLRLLFVSAGSR